MFTVRSPGARGSSADQVAASVSHVAHRVGAGRDPRVSAPLSPVTGGEAETRRGDVSPALHPSPPDQLMNLGPIFFPLLYQEALL